MSVPSNSIFLIRINRVSGQRVSTLSGKAGHWILSDGSIPYKGWMLKYNIRLDTGLTVKYLAEPEILTNFWPLTPGWPDILQKLENLIFDRIMDIWQKTSDRKPDLRTNFCTLISGEILNFIFGQITVIKTPDNRSIF